MAKSPANLLRNVGILIWKRRRYLIAIATVPVCIGLYVLIQQARLDEMIGRYEEDRKQWTPLFQSRFVRPVLRGTGRDCNASSLQSMAVRGVDLAPEQPEQPNERLEARGTLPPSPFTMPNWRDRDGANALEPLNKRLGMLDTEASANTKQLWSRNQIVLDALEQSAQCRFSRSANPKMWRLRTIETDSMQQRVLLKLLLARGQNVSPDQCLRSAADVFRIAQDYAAGTGMLGMAFCVSIAKLAALAVGRCARRASKEQLRDTMAEFATLRHHPLDIGLAFLYETHFYWDKLTVIGFNGKMILVPTSRIEFDQWRYADQVDKAMTSLVKTVPKWKTTRRGIGTLCV